MKRQSFIFFILFCVSISHLTAQKIHPNYVDGKICFQLKVTEPINFTVQEDRTISISEFPFLDRVKNTFGITKITRPFKYTPNPKLLRSVFIHFDSIQKVDQFEKYLHGIDVVENIEKEPILRLNWEPNDPYYGNSGNLNLKWYLDLIQADSAWNIQRGSSKIKVAVVDNAVWGEHPDLQIPSELQYDGTSNTIGNSAPPLSINQNVSCTQADLSLERCYAYEWSHGTHCAGLVGAVTNNASGMAAIGGGVTVIGVRCTYEGTTGINTEAIISGIDWAAHVKKVNVISMSYGGSEPFSMMETMYNELYLAGIVLIAAAGNDGVDDLHYPAAYSSVIAVASANSNKQLSSFSQYGPWVDIAAPGGYDMSSGYQSVPRAMFSTTFSQSQVLRLGGYTQFNGQYYDCMQGTSMACPVAAGLCGLMLSKNPNLTPDQVKSILQTTSMPVVGSNQINPNSGIINAYHAMQAVAATVPSASFTASDTDIAPDLTVSFTSTSTGSTQPTVSNISSYKWYFQGGNPSTSTDQNPSVTYSNPGIYTVTLVVTDGRGGKDSLVKENYINVFVPFFTPLVLESNKDTVLIDFYQTANGYFNITSNTSWTITVDTNDNGWVFFCSEIDSGNGNGTICVTLLENTSISSRTSTLIISSSDGSITLPVVIQQSAGLPVLNVNTNVISVGATARDATFNITSNTGWEISGGDSWVTRAFPLSGTGDNSINLEFQTNSSSVDRIARFNISGSGITKQVALKQEKAEVYLTVIPSSLTIEAPAGSQGVFYIRTNREWFVDTSLLSWLRVDSNSGTGDRMVTVTASANWSGAERERKLSIVAGGEERKVTVKQKHELGIDMIETENAKLNIFPNPATDNVSIEYILSNASKISIKIFNTEGKLLYQENLGSKASGKHIHILSCADMPKGVYIIQVLTDKTIKESKIIIN